MRTARMFLIGLILAAAAFTARAEPREADRSLTVTNSSQQTIAELRASSATEDDWGDDRLGAGGAIKPGETFVLRLPGKDCEYDVQATYEGGKTEERRGWNICRARQLAFDGSAAADGPSPGQQGNGGGSQGNGGQGNGGQGSGGRGESRSQPRSAPGEAQQSHDATLKNATARMVTEIYISAADADNWGADRLGDDQLAAGKSLSVTFTGDCLQDVRIVYDNKSAEERRGLDLCVHARLTITPGWLLAQELDGPPRPAPPSGGGSGRGGAGRGGGSGGGGTAPNGDGDHIRYLLPAR